MKATTLSHWRAWRREASLPYERFQTHPLPKMDVRVPSHIHTDLVANHLIANPFEERNEAGLRWIDESDWTYECEFEWSPTPEFPHRKLLFEGLDTVCDIFLNDALIGRSDNFFLPVEVEVTDRLEVGQNRIRIEFHSAVRTGDRARSEYFAENQIPTRTRLFDERSFVRKPGYMFGWDWGPRLVSCGIWRPVRLLEYRSRLTGCSVTQKPVGDGKFVLQPEFTLEGDGQVSFEFCGRPVDGADCEVREALWWCHGEGEPTLHPFTFRTDAGQEVTRFVGLRTIELIQEPDRYGRGFEFALNGRGIWCRGANWIPNDSFPSRIREADYIGAIQRFASVGMNMLRVWGGGYYESEAFYDQCDRNGMLVWQDFPYACCFYPDDESHRVAAEAEAAFHVKRLRDRASLAIWCGNNENRALWYGNWAGEDAPSRFYGESIFEEVLPAVVRRHDPGRLYLASSPLLVKGMPDVPEDPASFSDDHYWDSWHGRGDWTFYRDSNARFSSEFGFASSCSMASWRDVSERHLELDDPTVLWHDKTNKGWETFKSYVSLHYPESQSLEEWVYYSQLNQRDAMRFAIEHYRAGKRCRGALIWQANDCWPVQSWSLEDYRRLMKPAGMELRRLFAPLLLCPKISERGLDVIVANDADSAFDGTMTLETYHLPTSALVARQAVPFSVQPSERIHAVNALLPPLPREEAAIRLYENQYPHLDRWIFLTEPKQLRTAPVEIQAVGAEGKAVVTCSGLALDLVLESPESPLKVGDFEVEGFPAVSGLNLQLEVRGIAPLRQLNVRSLAGSCSIKITEG